jgi:hypothetical protein
MGGRFCLLSREPRSGSWLRYQLIGAGGAVEMLILLPVPDATSVTNGQPMPPKKLLLA